MHPLVRIVLRCSTCNLYELFSAYSAPISSGPATSAPAPDVPNVPNVPDVPTPRLALKVRSSILTGSRKKHINGVDLAHKDSYRAL